ncbi:MAG: type II toxin-antitoxin system RelE/ParE family toxin [Chlamydiae bacterium]|nr:type II toxin-antitoxin system RelE/ParE family toxin [Chlamydiota bacterium]
MEKPPFKVEFLDREAFNQFIDLPKATQKILGKAIKGRLEIDPISFGKPLRYSLKGHRRLRIGDYKIVYRINK